MTTTLNSNNGRLVKIRYLFSFSEGSLDECRFFFSFWVQSLNVWSGNKQVTSSFRTRFASPIFS